MTPLDYEFLRKLLKERSGLDLSSDKQYLVESRLIPLARKAGVSGIGDGRLADIAPTVLALMGMTQPPAMTGHNLLIGSASDRGADSAGRVSA